MNTTFLQGENTIIGLVMDKMLFDTAGCTVDVLQDEFLTEKKITLSVLRLDKIHATVSGNKLFKLHYFLQEAITSSHKTILTFGGAYSNHLVATAYACKNLSLKSIGIVRGEKPPQLSTTLQQCIHFGMQLKFISREAYTKKEDTDLIAGLQEEFGDSIIIPEGGYNNVGAKGAALIMGMIKENNYSHMATAIGTATTLAGLLMAAKHDQTIIGVPVLKDMTDINDRIKYLTNDTPPQDNLQLLEQYHFGGYAKYTPELMQFMNACWRNYALPLDFVYTAKMMYGIIDSIKANRFEPGSTILCLHTGGLQGNSSLPAGTLLY
jgi:1-aminocyclopropane-1-carboxylate deaminase